MTASPVSPEVPKACPFCGGTPEVSRTRVWWYVCADCGAEGPHGPTKIKAIEAWNRRAVSEGPSAPTEGILISDISRAVRAWNDCEVDSDLVRMKRALLADRASRRAPVTHDPEGPAAPTRAYADESSPDVLSYQIGSYEIVSTIGGRALLVGDDDSNPVASFVTFDEAKRFGRQMVRLLNSPEHCPECGNTRSFPALSEHCISWHRPASPPSSGAQP